MNLFFREPQRRLTIIEFFSNKITSEAQNNEQHLDETQRIEQQKYRLSAKETIGAFGFGILLCWIFLCYFSDAFFQVASIGQTVESGVLRWVGLGMFSLMMILFLVGSDFFTKIDMRKFSVIPIVLGAALPLTEYFSFIGVPSIGLLLFLAWGLNGVATACAFLIWAHYFCRLSKAVIVTSGVISVLVAGCWYFVVLLLPEIIQSLGIYISLVLSVICILIYSGESSSLPSISRRDSEENFGPDIKTSISMAVAGCAHGFLLYYIILNQTESAVGIIGSAFLVAAGIIWVINKVKGRYALLLAPVFRMSLVPLVLGFVLLPFIEGVALAICEVILLAFLLGHWVSLFVNISFVIQKYEVQSFYLWVRGNIPIFIGVCIGWGIGVAAFYLLGGTGLFGVPTILLCSLFFVVMFTLSTAITPYGIDHLTIREDFEYVDLNGEFKATRKAWCKACETIAKRSELTPRETDVLFLLAKGRSSRVIERELSISINTVKSHNYNIYKKVGVDSQQALIDIIESVRLKIKEID